MYSPGCRASAACSAVVPAFGTPITRKSGMDTGASRERDLYLTIPIRLVRNSHTGYPYPAGVRQSPRRSSPAAVRAGANLRHSGTVRTRPDAPSTLRRLAVPAGGGPERGGGEGGRAPEHAGGDEGSAQARLAPVEAAGRRPEGVEAPT